MSHEESGGDLLRLVNRLLQHDDAPVKGGHKAVVLSLVLVLMLQLALCAVFAFHKTGLFQDESYTYFLANGDWLHSVPEEGVVYDQGEPWLEWASSNGLSDINFELLYKNQEADNHPPLYYLLFSMAYSLFPRSVNPLIGVGLNIIFALITTVELYFLCRLLRAPRMLALLLCLLWAINPGMINCMLYLRMYQMLGVFFPAAALASLAFLRSDSVRWYQVASLFVITAAGFLTQYFFVFFAFVLYLSVGLVLLGRRRIGHAALFALGSVGGIAAGFALFPPSFDHLFSSFRGQEALGRAASGDSFASYLVEDFRLLNSGVFGLLLPVVLMAAAMLFAVFFLRRRSRVRGSHVVEMPGGSGLGLWTQGIAILAVSTICYWILVARVAPYASIRYLMPVNGCLMIWPYLLLFSAVFAVSRGNMRVALGATLVVGALATGLGYMQGIKYLDQQNDKIVELAEDNSAMVALWGDPILQDAVFQDALLYQKTVYFNTIEAFETFNFKELGQDFTLYVQKWVDPDQYFVALENHPGASIAYVGHDIDSSYAVYDVHID